MVEEFLEYMYLILQVIVEDGEKVLHEYGGL